MPASFSHGPRVPQKFFAPPINRAGMDGLVITPASVGLVLTGFAPTVSTPRVITPAEASLVLTGFAPTVATPRLVTPAKASLALTGFAPTIATPRVITPARASLNLAGFAPTITASTNQTIIPRVLTLTLTGYQPDVQGDHQGSALGRVVSDTGRRRHFPSASDEARPPEPIVVRPAALHLTLTTYAPLINKASSVAFTLDELIHFAGDLTDLELAAVLAA